VPGDVGEEHGHDLAHRGSRSWRCPRWRHDRLQVAVVLEDCTFEPSQVLAGLESQLFTQYAPAVPVDVERIRLPTGAIKGEH
jgi:hypothetical protein